MEDLIVKAVPGRTLPIEETPQQFVGLRKLNPREHEPLAKEIVLAVEGAKFVATGPVRVPNTLYYRRALLRGDVVRVNGGK